MAKAIHGLDPRRRQGPFVAVNCGAINPGLIETELFGHRRGAFTGAERNRKGLIRAAEGGVLFLDEVGELSFSLQAKLLRVLQENLLVVVGEEREILIDVRFIAATNRDLEQMVEAGQFRADLFHRLSVLHVHIPPLRERSSDLPFLIEHFVRKHHSPNGQQSPGIDPEFMDAFMHLELPGNARQVEHLVCEALVNRQGDGELGLRDFPAAVLRQLTELVTGLPSARADTADDKVAQEQMEGCVRRILDKSEWNLTRASEEWERQVFAVALKQAQGNQSETARLLGITRRSVYTKLHKHTFPG